MRKIVHQIAQMVQFRYWATKLVPRDTYPKEFILQLEAVVGGKDSLRVKLPHSPDNIDLELHLANLELPSDVAGDNKRPHKLVRTKSEKHGSRLWLHANGLVVAISSIKAC